MVFWWEVANVVVSMPVHASAKVVFLMPLHASAQLGLQTRDHLSLCLARFNGRTGVASGARAERRVVFTRLGDSRRIRAGTRFDSVLPLWIHLCFAFVSIAQSGACTSIHATWVIKQTICSHHDAGISARLPVPPPTHAVDGSSPSFQ